MGRGEAGQPRTVLIVDDDPQFRTAAMRWRFGDLRISTVAEPGEAIDRVRAERPAIVIIDWFLGDRACGVDLIGPLRGIHPSLRIAIASAALTTARTVFATKAGADVVIDKPFSLATVLRWLDDGIAARDLAAAALERLEDSERRHIARVLAETGGNLRVAARRLAVSRNRLKRKLDSIPPPRGAPRRAATKTDER